VRREQGSETERLGVVENDEVGRREEPGDRGRLAGESVVVEEPLVPAPGSAVAVAAVQVIVDPLRDGEEVFAPLDRDLPPVHTEAARGPDERPQQLGDATTLERRVHVPHDPALELPSRLRHDLHEPFVAFAAERGEQPVAGLRCHGNVTHGRTKGRETSCGG